MSSTWTDVMLQKTGSDLVPARVYRGADVGPGDPLVVYFHGGAFADASHGVDRPIAESLAEAGATVLTCDYGALSRNMFPMSLDIAFSTLEYVSAKRAKFASRDSPLVIAGEESGGTVAAGLVLMARDQLSGSIDGQILLSPLLDPFMSSTSMRHAAEVGMRDRWTDGWSHYLAQANNACHPYAAPSFCSRLAFSPRTLVVTAEDDPLKDEAVGYAGRLDKAGVTVSQHVFPAGMGWPNLYGGQTSEPARWSDDLRACFTKFFAALAEDTFRHGAEKSA